VINDVENIKGKGYKKKKERKKRRSELQDGQNCSERAAFALLKVSSPKNPGSPLQSLIRAFVELYSSWLTTNMACKVLVYVFQGKCTAPYCPMGDRCSSTYFLNSTIFPEFSLFTI
jgi:hypothetical protein